MLILFFFVTFYQKIQKDVGIFFLTKFFDEKNKVTSPLLVFLYSLGLGVIMIFTVLCLILLLPNQTFIIFCHIPFAKCG